MHRLKLEQQLQLEGSSVELIEERIQALDHTAKEPSADGNGDPHESGDDKKPNIEPETDLVQLFDITEDGEIIFNKGVLDDLCDQIGDRPVSIISTAGKFRQGKTFWNNVLLKGLQQGKADFKPTDYIGGHNGIRFQSGYIRHTKGIMVWPKVFIRKDKEGKELAVILMDTQGTFDTTSDMIDSAIIFSISLLMSSIKIFNVRTQIDAQDLDSLNLFLAFGKRTDERAGQHFIIMIRDALESGFQPSYIETLQTQTRRVAELNKLFEGIFSAFEKVECFMAKTPSEHVMSASGEIKAQDCGDRFLEDLCECANHVLENLVPKTFMGNHLTGNTLKRYVENLVDHIKENNHKAIGSAFQATSELFFEKAKAAAAEYFAAAHDQLMRESGHQPINPKVYEKILKKFVDEALQEYSSKPLFGTQEAKERTFLALKESLEAKCQEKLLSNRSRFRDFLMADAVHQSSELYEKGMKPDFGDSLPGKATVEQVKDRHEKAFPEAMSLFENAVAPFNDEVDLIESKRNLLTKMILTRFEDLQSDNLVVQVNASLDSMINTLADNYGKHLKEQVTSVKKLDEIGMFIERGMNALNTNFEANKAQFIIDVSQLMPNLDLSMLRQMIDKFKDAKGALFKQCEDYFESAVRAHLNMEKLRNKMIDMRHRQNEAQKRLQAQQGRIQEQPTDTQQQLDDEKRKREATAKSNDLNPIFLLLKQMNEQTPQQLENAREERQRKEMREAQEEQNRLEKEGNEARIRMEEIILEKKNELAQLKKEKDVLKGAEKFVQEFRTKIHKISTPKEALHWERNSILEKYGGFTIPSTTIHSIKETLNTKIITLKSPFIQTRLNELNNELRVYMLTTNFGNVPEEDQIKDHIKKIIQSFKKECFENAIESAEFDIIERNIQITLQKTGLICRNMLSLEAELAAEIQKSYSANYSDIASDSEDDLEEEHEICKTQSIGTLNLLDTFKEKKEKESAETSLELRESHRPPPCCKPISQPSQEVKLANEGNIVDDSGMKKTIPRFEVDQKETTYANEDLVDSRSASLPINFPHSDSPEYDEISDTEIDRYVSKTLDDDAVREMDSKFRVLKALLEQIDDKNEKRRHFEEIYQEYAVWCEIRIDPKVMMYFVHKFHTECALYMREHHGIEVNVRRYENEIIRRTEDPKWTDAQKLKRKVLQRGKSMPTKKKICAQRVGDVFNDLLAEEFNNVLKCGSFSIAKISALIECSKSKRDFFSRTLCKYDKYGELPGLLEKVLVNNWISFFYCLPHDGFGERETINEYERVRRDLPLNVPTETHIALLSNIKEWFIRKKKNREWEERERRENEEKQRQVGRLRRQEDENKFSLLKLPSICYRLLQATVSSHGTTSQYQERPQAITYHQRGSRSNQRTDSSQEMDQFRDRVGRMQNDFHYSTV